MASVLALTVAWRLGYFELGRREHVVGVIRYARQNSWAAPLYVSAYVLVVVLALPATVFSILGGAVFGTARGLVLAWSGAIIGTAVAHMLARSIGQAPVRRFFGRHPLLRRMRERVDVWMLVRLRVLPIAPFGVLDYVAGLAGVPLRTLLLATAVGIVPGMTAYVYAGDQLAQGLEQAGSASHRGLWIAAAVTCVMVLVSFVPALARQRRLRRSFRGRSL